jgi:DNA-binding CsgD family transcriptional regulator
MGCRLGSAETCCLLALSMAHDVDAFWFHTQRFFSDFNHHHGMALGMAIHHDPVVFLRHKPSSMATDGLTAILQGARTDHPVVTGPFDATNAHATALTVWTDGALHGCVIFLCGDPHSPFPAAEIARLEQYQPAYAAMMNHFIAGCGHEIESSFWQHLIHSLPHDQREIVNLASHGLTNKEIADRLERSEASVKFHLHQTYLRFGLRNRAELALHSGEASPAP